jgi:hypothetical protein
MDRVTGRQVHYYALPRCSTRSRPHSIHFLAMLCALGAVLFVNEASAQCSARATLGNKFSLNKTSSAVMPPTVVISAAATPVWKTITVGTFANTFDLRNALDAADCGTGDLADEVLARPSFTLSATKTSVDLVAVSVIELGLQTETASLAEIYARAKELGFRLAAAEVGPQLRLQYFDQPSGEFLTVAMEPIKTWEGEPVILVVANGGAGLRLIGEDAGTNAVFYSGSRFLFVRSANVETAHKQ